MCRGNIIGQEEDLLWILTGSAAKIFGAGFGLICDSITRFRQRYLLMQIIAQCPGCGNAWLLGADAADRRVRCQSCHRLFRIPKLNEVPRAVKIIRQAKGTIYVDQNGKIYG